MTRIACTRRWLLRGSTAGLALAALGRGAEAQLRVDVNRGTVEPLPIAISPLAGDGSQGAQLGASIADVVSNDLDGSGLFRTIDRRAYIQSPNDLRSAPRFADWRQINAQALVTGIARSDGVSLSVEYRLWDIFAGTQLTGLRFETASGQWRRVAHKIADSVYERLTGEGGYFDTRIAYIAESGPATRRVKRLAIMDQDGANDSLLTDGHDLVLTPRFSPDARQIAYLAFRGRSPRVYIRDVASGRDALLGDFPGMTFSPRFSPDGRAMLLSMATGGNSSLFTYDRATGRTARLTDSGAIDTSPSYAPDGRQIVFNSDRGGTPQLYVMAASGGAARRISFGEGRYGSPEWSPRGDLITFTKILKGSLMVGDHAPGRQRRADADQELSRRGPDLGAERPRHRVRPQRCGDRSDTAVYDRHYGLQSTGAADPAGCFRSRLVAASAVSRNGMRSGAGRVQPTLICRAPSPPSRGLKRMRLKLVILGGALMLLAACSSSPDATKGTTAGGAGASGAGAGGEAGISSSALGSGSGASGNVAPGSQQDLEVNVGDRVFFAFDSSSLDAKAQETLDHQAAWLLQFPNLTVTVEGNTDERGTREYNLALGERRANAVKSYLVAKGVPASRIQTISYGSERPADPGHDESAWALNRRAVTNVNVSS